MTASERSGRRTVSAPMLWARRCDRPARTPSAPRWGAILGPHGFGRGHRRIPLRVRSCRSPRQSCRWGPRFGLLGTRPVRRRCTIRGRGRRQCDSVVLATRHRLHTDRTDGTAGDVPRGRLDADGDRGDRRRSVPEPRTPPPVRVRTEATGSTVTSVVGTEHSVADPDRSPRGHSGQHPCCSRRRVGEGGSLRSGLDADDPARDAAVMRSAIPE